MKTKLILLATMVMTLVACEKKNDKEQDPTPPTGVQMIDLGLSVKWADRNLNATVPEDFGMYFAWGEIRPKSNYEWSTYFDTSDREQTFIKYNNDGGKTVLDFTDDAARVSMGGTWRIPSMTEWTELMNNCQWTYTTLNGVYGYRVAAMNGNSIFLPAARDRIGNEPEEDEPYGCYWSANLCDYVESAAYLLSFDRDYATSEESSRCYGLPIRAVCK